jgi:hypothetical protein
MFTRPENDLIAKLWDEFQKLDEEDLRRLEYLSQLLDEQEYLTTDHFKVLQQLELKGENYDNDNYKKIDNETQIYQDAYPRRDEKLSDRAGGEQSPGHYAEPSDLPN